MGAVGKIMWSLILIETGLCKKGTANKGFEHKLLREARVHLHNGIWKEFMMHNSVDWLMTCKTFATYCAYRKTMDQTHMKLASF